MAFFDFLQKNNKTVRCARCGSNVKEKDSKQFKGQIYCASCHAKITAPVKTSTPEKPKGPQITSVQIGNTPVGCHPAIQEIKNAFDAANLHSQVIHAGDQWEVIAGVNGKANTYQIKFICKENARNDVAMRIFDLCSFPQDRRQNAFPLLNKFQRQYRFLRFTMDDDNSVKVEYDLPSCSTDLGPSAVEMMLRTMKIIDDIYPELMKALWA